MADDGASRSVNHAQPPPLVSVSACGVPPAVPNATPAPSTTTLMLLVWRCCRCGKVKELSGDHLRGKTQVRSDCWPCGVKRVFVLGEEAVTTAATAGSVPGAPTTTTMTHTAAFGFGFKTAALLPPMISLASLPDLTGLGGMQGGNAPPQPFLPTLVGGVIPPTTLPGVSDAAASSFRVSPGLGCIPSALVDTPRFNLLANTSSVAARATVATATTSPPVAMAAAGLDTMRSEAFEREFLSVMEHAKFESTLRRLLQPEHGGACLVSTCGSGMGHLSSALMRPRVVAVRLSTTTDSADAAPVAFVELGSDTMAATTNSAVLPPHARPGRPQKPSSASTPTSTGPLRSKSDSGTIRGSVVATTHAAIPQQKVGAAFIANDLRRSPTRQPSVRPVTDSPTSMSLDGLARRAAHVADVILGTACELVARAAASAPPSRRGGAPQERSRVRITVICHERATAAALSIFVKTCRLAERFDDVTPTTTTAVAAVDATGLAADAASASQMGLPALSSESAGSDGGGGSRSRAMSADFAALPAFQAGLPSRTVPNVSFKIVAPSPDITADADLAEQVCTAYGVTFDACNQEQLREAAAEGYSLTGGVVLPPRSAMAVALWRKRTTEPSCNASTPNGHHVARGGPSGSTTFTSPGGGALPCLVAPTVSRLPPLAEQSPRVGTSAASTSAQGGPSFPNVTGEVAPATVQDVYIVTLGPRAETPFVSR